MTKAVFLDRDGTLIKDVHYLKNPEHVEIIEGVSDALQKILQAGYLLFMHTNQSGITRGYYDLKDVHSCNQRILELLDFKTDFWSGICIAPESPKDSDQGYRKPSHKFQMEMIEKHNLDPSKCWMVGDKWVDAETGLRAKMNSALVETGKEIDSKIKQLSKSQNVPICKNLLFFASNFLKN